MLAQQDYLYQSSPKSEAKGRCLSCPCLGLTNDILTCHSKWNRLLLNRACFYKASFSISASNSADKCNSLNFNVLLLSKGGAKPPYKAFDTQLSKHTKFFPLLNLDFLRVFALLFINMVSQVQALKSADSVASSH